MRDAWGRAAIVEGWVERNSLTGMPAVVSDIVGIHLITEGQPAGFQFARGILPREQGDPLPEDRIRLVRDA